MPVPGSSTVATAPVPDDGRSHLFLVRLWWEPDERDTSGEWRGSVEHVATREKRYFREIEVMAEFVGHRVGWKARSPPAPRQPDEGGYDH
jgi:hypothetical protein